MKDRGADPAVAAWRARQLRRIAVFVCLPGLLLGLGMAGGAYAAGLFDRKPVRCAVSLVGVPTRSSFPVAVRNGSGRSGLAGEAAASLRRAGFRVGLVDNAPDHEWTDEPAVVWHGPQGLAQAQLVASQLRGARIHADQRPGTAIEVVVGTRFAKGPAAAVAMPPAATRAADDCSVTDGSS